MYEKLDAEQQAGFDYQSKNTGESIEDMILRLVGEHGMTYYRDMKSMRLQQVLKKISGDPEAYVDVIEAKAAELAAVAAEEAATVKP